MISVSRNIHMPKVEVSFCCSMSAKWCCSACSATWISLVANGDLLLRLVLVVVSFPGYDRSLVEVERRRRRRSHPLQTDRIPGIRTCRFPVAQRPQEVNHRQHIADSQNGSARGGEYVEHLEFRRIRMITARRTHVAQQELRKERGVESHEHQQRRELRPRL